MGGLGFLFIIGIRLFIYWSGKRAVATGRPQPAWVARMNSTRSIRPAIIGLGVRGAFLVGALLTAINGHWGWACLFLIVGLPQLIINLLLIPSGIPYASYYFTRVVHPQATLAETRGGAVFNELRARLRWGLMLDRASTARLTKDLVDFGTALHDRAVRAATLTARAMLDAIEGDGEHARELFAVAQTLAALHGARSVRAYCQAWLLTDAVRRRAYHEVIRIAARIPRTRRRLFLGGAARRLLGLSNAPRPWVLVCYWLLAPARVHTWTLLQSALRAEFRAELEPEGQGLAAARTVTLALMRLPRGAASRAALRGAARIWQSVFDSGEVRALMTARCDALQGTFDVQVVVARFEGEIVALLARLWQDSLLDGESDANEPPLILAAKDQLQSELLGELESLCLALPKGASRTTDDLEQHWRTWARVRSLAQLFFDTLPDRGYLVFQTAGGELLNHAAWLFNKERARILAHDIFRFLYKLAPEDDPNRVILGRNVRLSA